MTDSMKKKDTLGKAIADLISPIVYFILKALVVFVIWNIFIPGMFYFAEEISLFEAIALMVVINILFKKHKPIAEIK